MTLPHEIMVRLQDDGVTAQYVADHLGTDLGSATFALTQAGAAVNDAGKYTIPAHNPIQRQPPPPPRPGPRDLARQLNLTDVDALAQTILINGRPVSRRTLYKWFHRGAPFDSEPALRAWVAAHHIPVGPAQPTLADAIGAALTQSVAQNAPPAPAGQGGTAADQAKEPDTTGLSAAQQAALARRDKDLVQTEKAALELSILQRKHLHQAQAAAAIRDLAQEVITGLTDLVPRTLREIPTTLDADLRQQVREALQKNILHLRTHLTTKAPELLKKALGIEGVTP